MFEQPAALAVEGGASTPQPTTATRAVGTVDSHPQHPTRDAGGDGLFLPAAGSGRLWILDVGVLEHGADVGVIKRRWRLFKRLQTLFDKECHGFIECHIFTLCHYVNALC